MCFKKLKSAIQEYEAETGKHITLHDFFVKVLNYSEEEYTSFLGAKHTKIKKKKSGESKRMNLVPILKSNIGDRENPEYKKYYNMVLEFRKYMCNKEIVSEDGKKTMRSFMKYAYGLEGDTALAEMRKIENIVYKGKKSSKPKRNKRRAKREEYFNEKLNLG